MESICLLFAFNNKSFRKINGVTLNETNKSKNLVIYGFTLILYYKPIVLPQWY